MLNSNFDKTAYVKGTKLEVSGTNAELPDDHELLLRSFVIHQKAACKRLTDVVGDGDWKKTFAKGAFTEGDAVVLGTETHYVKGTPPGYLTLSWSQLVTIKKSP